MLHLIQTLVCFFPPNFFFFKILISFFTSKSIKTTALYSTENYNVLCLSLVETPPQKKLDKLENGEKLFLGWFTAFRVEKVKQQLSGCNLFLQTWFTRGQSEHLHATPPNSHLSSGSLSYFSPYTTLLKFSFPLSVPTTTPQTCSHQPTVLACETFSPTADRFDSTQDI